MSKMQKVTVIVPERPNYPGIWGAGKFWATGEHEAEVTQEELQTLASKRGLIVQQGGKTIRLEQAPTAMTNVQVTSDEAQVLEQYRRDRHTKALAEQQAASAEASFSKTKESVDDATARALRDSAPSPATHADAPAEHRDMLQGEKPKNAKK